MSLTISYLQCLWLSVIFNVFDYLLSSMSLTICYPQCQCVHIYIHHHGFSVKQATLLDEVSLCLDLGILLCLNHFFSIVYFRHLNHYGHVG